MTLDFDGFFRNRIENLLIRASWVGAVRKAIGLEGVSQVWGGNAQWYFWLSGAPGAYCLAFVDAEHVHVDDRDLYEGSFALKCYPCPADPGFSDFSREERRWVESARFDATGTPRFEAAVEIPQALFTIGSISLLLDPRQPIALLSYESLDALKTRTTVPGPENDCSPDAGLIRNVAGWATGYPLFDCLVGLFAHSGKRPPVFAGATRSVGFEYVVLPGAKPRCRSTDQITQLSMSVGFDLPENGCGPAESLWQARLEAGEAVLAAGPLPVCLDRETCFGNSDDFRLNSAWWKVAALECRSDLKSICGCCADHCQHRPQGGPVAL